jgi:prepilin-type N-terminal cleavage/methylation domain-containing protein
MKRGFTLLEVVVVIAIIAVLSLIGVNSVNNFRQEAVLDSTVNEFIAVLKSAKNKSMAGEIPEGMGISDFYSDPDGTPVGLPKYGVEVKPGTYYLTRNYTISDGSVKKECQTDNGIWLIDCSTYLVIPSELSINSGVVEFSRISGTTTHTSFNIIKVSNGKGENIDISPDGIIKITNI